MSNTPFSHEPSWFASLLYISGKNSGYVMRDDFEPMEEKGAYAYADEAIERSTDLPAFLLKLADLVEENGYLLISCLPQHSQVVENTKFKDFILIEKSWLDGRTFYCFGNKITHDAVPEVLVFRNGGGIGDVYHAAAVAEEYAKQGFNTCFMAMEKVKHVFAANPHIKRFVPIPSLPDAVLYRFMNFWSKRCRLFINLDWSIEGFLLKKEILSEYFWGDEQRRALCGKGYARNVADLAGLPDVARITHYTTVEEQKTAEEVMNRNKFVFIQLSGSGDVHKWSPHIDKLCVMLLARTEKSIYISHTNAQAGLAMKIKKHIAENYGTTDRVVFSDQKRSFSVNVEIAKLAEVVLGPETGLMVALSHEENIRKILLVSHSSVSNFEDWKNTVFLEAKDLPCHPCHRMHSDFRYCHRDEKSGAAKCMSMIDASRMFAAIMKKDQEFLVVAPQEDAQKMAIKLNKSSIPVGESDTPDILRQRLAGYDMGFEPWEDVEPRTLE